MSSSAERLTVLVPPCIALLAVLAWSTRYDVSAALAHDAAAYFAMANDLLTGSFGPLLGRDAGLFLDPGYPIALSLWFRVLGPSVTAGMLLNAAFWASSAALFTGIVRNWLTARRAVIAGSVFAISPMLTSFAPKLYSEHLAIAGLLLALWAWLRLRDGVHLRLAALPLTGLATGTAILVLTKSTFYPLAGIVAIILAARRHWSPACVVALAAAVTLPVHLEVERGGRNRMAAAHQAAMVVQWPVPVALRCGVYSLSRNLGLKLFPEVEGACEPFSVDPHMPLAALNPRVLSRQWLEAGFSIRDAVRIAAEHPAKYVLVCGVNLLAACWLEGFYPQALDGSPEIARTLLWVLKAALSTALWCLAITGALRAWRRPSLRPFAVALAVPLLYLLAVHANVLGEQRYFLPAIPILYALAALGLSARNPVQVMSSRDNPNPAETMETATVEGVFRSRA
jgi:hypothetical protein